MQRRPIDDRQPAKSAARKAPIPVEYQDERSSRGTQSGWNENQRKEWPEEEFDAELLNKNHFEFQNRAHEAFGNPWRYETSHAGSSIPTFEGQEKNETRSAVSIETEIRELLSHHATVNATDVEVMVADGIVTLTGTVPKIQMRKEAEEAASRVAGVREVLNGLQVVHTEHDPSAPSTPEARAVSAPPPDPF